MNKGSPLGALYSFLEREVRRAKSYPLDAPSPRLAPEIKRLSNSVARCIDYTVIIWADIKICI